jgi:type II secretory pathway pseudopilin PulG
LIELMSVILIIALVVAILLPALGSVRGKSREASTRNLMANLSQSIAMFETDQKRLPGYFSVKEMGDLANRDAGFSAMNNVLLDLAGGVVPSGTAGAVEIGPLSNSGVFYHPDKVGTGSAGSKAYFTPPPANWKSFNGGEYGTKSVNVAGNRSVNDLVDAEGQPILVWMQDPMAVGPIKSHADIAIATSANTLTGVSRFYGNSNYVFLNSNSCGKKGIDQQTESILSPVRTNSIVNLAGMLGAPGSPIDVSQAVGGIFPSAPRGSFVLQSAGRNSIFLGQNERGATLMGPMNTLFYGLNFKDSSNNPIRDANGGTTSSDILKDFDDIVIAGS